MKKLLKIFLMGLVPVYLIACNGMSNKPTENYRDAKTAIVKIMGQNKITNKISVGTGFIVAQDDNKNIYIITQAHVIEGDPHPEILFHGDIKANAEQVWNGENIGTQDNAPAMLKVTTVSEEGEVSRLSLSKESCRDILSVFTYGFPEGGKGWDLGQANFSNSKQYDSICEFEKPTNIEKGNSGGPLIDLQVYNHEKKLIVRGVIASVIKKIEKGDDVVYAISSTDVQRFIKGNPDVGEKVIEAMKKPESTVSLSYRGETPLPPPIYSPPVKPEPPKSYPVEKVRKTSSSEVGKKSFLKPMPEEMTCQCGVIMSKISMNSPLSEHEKKCISSNSCRSH